MSDLFYEEMGDQSFCLQPLNNVDSVLPLHYLSSTIKGVFLQLLTIS